MAFLDSIKNIIQYFREGKVKKLVEIFDPKLGITFSNKLIAKIVKLRINTVLSNVSILPLEMFSSFFDDDENRTVQIIFDLINKKEINAQIIFIEEKTFIAPTNLA